MATVRPLAEEDVAAAGDAFDRAFAALRAALGLPVAARTQADAQRVHRRIAHFQATDPGGSWVAEDRGTIVGMSQAFVREGWWVLSLLGVATSSLWTSRAGGYAGLAFAALGVYLYASTASVATGGRALPLGHPIMR